MVIVRRYTIKNNKMKYLLIILFLFPAFSQAQSVGSIAATIKDQYANCYGVEWDVTRATPVMRRIGDTAMHRTLPVQSQMRRCVLKDDGTVNYYLDESNSTLKADGVTAADLTGADGQVMVELPDFWWKFETSGNKQRVWISTDTFPDAMHVSTVYISAYEAAINRTTNTLASVVNMTADYRGGSNQSAWDGTYRTMLGKPVTVMGRTELRTAARNRGTGWQMDVYKVEKELFWLRAIEYANMNCQLPFNATLTEDGYAQGGLSDGVTGINSTDWNTYNSRYPLTPCGVTNELGNHSGVVSYTVASWPGGDITVSVPSYRGVENPFGDIWSIVDGINFKIESDADGGQSEIYVFDDPADYSDADYTNGRLAGLLPRSSNYMTKIVMGKYGDFVPVEANGGSSTTYWSDYFYTVIPSSGTELRVLLLGGSASYTAAAGVGCSYTLWAPSPSHSTVGSRLCFLP